MANKVNITIYKLLKDGTFEGRVDHTNHPLEDCRVVGTWERFSPVGTYPAEWVFRHLEVEGVGVLNSYFNEDHLAGQAELYWEEQNA